MIRAGGWRGRGRPGSSARGRYGEMRQQYGDRDMAERPSYSNVRGRGTRNDAVSQRRDYTYGVNDRRQAGDQYRPERSRGSGRQAVVDREHCDDRQPVYAESGQQEEDWNEEIATSYSTKQVEQPEENVHAVSMHAPDDRIPARRPPHRDHRVSEGVVRSQQQEDRHMHRELPRRVVHQTRTISNSNYHTADSASNRDRGSQIGGIVDAMNRISVKTATDNRREVSNTPQNVAARSAMIVTGTESELILTILLVVIILTDCA